MIQLISSLALITSVCSTLQTTEIKGKILTHTDKKLTISMTDASIKKGDKLTLLKYTTGQMGKMTFTSWLDIADVTVVSNSKNVITVLITQENSVTMVNGKKKDHFTKNSEVKFEKK
ncbi:MAG: hypothetical protein ACK476_14385 [Fluviicola sp.]